MTPGAWSLIGLLSAILITLVVLLWPQSGLGFTWTYAPGGPLKYRLHRGSLVPQILGSDACCLFNVVHVGTPTLSGYLHAHEVCHAIQARTHGGWVLFLGRYLAEPSFRRQMEAEAHDFGVYHRANTSLASHRRAARVT
jgi:hypothetical protein